MNYSIACIVVTYNRKDFLKQCLHHISNQTYKPKTVYIVDNASTDGTIESVKEWGYYNCHCNDIEFQYLLNKKNEGGAGGFYLGIKTAFESNQYDAIWVMDDDGAPDKDSLKYLIQFLHSHDYIAPIVLSPENHDICSFVPNTSFKSFCLRANKEGFVPDFASPFNGILYSSRLIKQIGYPKKEMFIWGDESNYDIRARKVGAIPITVIKAIHFHPVDRQKYIELPNGKTFLDINSDWKMYCYIRNMIYNTRIRDGFFICARRCVGMWLKCMFYFKIKPERKNKLLVLDALICGLLGNFNRLGKYFNETNK